MAGDLGPAFRGTAAGTGARLLAFTLDALVVVAVLVAGWLAFDSRVLAVVLAVETVAALTLWEARTGLTVGNALLRLRTACADRPFSPGVGRELARSLVVGLGALGAVVGAWIVVASGAWDSSGRRRTWADRAGGTLVVAVPRPRRGAAGAVPAVAPGGYVPAAAAIAAAPALPAAAVRPLAVTPSGSYAGTPPVGAVSPFVPQPVAPQPVAPLPVAPQPVAPQPVTPQPLASQPLPAQPVAPQPVPPRVAPAAPVAPPAVAAPAAPTPAPRAAVEQALLLVFDTGQRESVPLGANAVLGRTPSPVDEHDVLLPVRDDEGTVSKNHLRIEHGRDGVWLTDLGSTNGTRLVDEDGTTRIPTGVRTALDDGVRVRIGRRAFTVSVVVREV